MKRGFFLILASVITVWTAFAGGNGDGPSSGEIAGSGDNLESVRLPSILVEPAWLEENRETGNIVILDTGRKRDGYAAGHIPGAVYVDRNGYWTAVDGVPGMFAGVDAVTDVLEKAGVSSDSAVVVYDAGNSLWASRLAWTLAYLGHDNWAVLDGGYGLWDTEGYGSDRGTADPPRGSFVPKVRDELLVSGAEVAAGLGDPDVVVVDTRSAGEYEGTDVRAERGGHIPGAVPIEWSLNNSDDTVPTLLSAGELAEFYASQGVTADKEVVTLCQTGVRGAHTWFALTLAGYDNVSLYDGSWADWGNNEAYPVETGAP